MTPPLPAELTLKSGAHTPGGNDMCVMEAVAYVAGEEWTDTPQCACPVIGAFLRSWNDGITDDATRTRLLAPFIPHLVWSKSTREVEDTRSWLAVDWSVRVSTPAWLDIAGLATHADVLRALPEVTAMTVSDAQPIINAAWDAARDAVWDAAWDAARDAARDAVWDAARAAAWAAARDAVWAAARAAAWAAARDAVWSAAWAAAWDAARAAAWVAARDAAWVAARDAARDAAQDTLAPTVITLQASAVDLVNRMLAVQP